MSVNEILAPFYVKFFYRVLTGHIHSTRWYFDAVPSFGVNGAVFDTYTDATHLTGWTLHDVILEIDTRLQLSTTQYPPYDVIKVERWLSATGANVFKGLDPADYSDIVGGTGTPIAAAEFNWVFQDDDRNSFRFGFIDGLDSRPQRFELPQPPVLDDGGIDWFLLRSPIGFTTNDGVRLTRAVSNNTGVNKYAARKYGKTVIP